jgi:hypothetical protein
MVEALDGAAPTTKDVIFKKIDERFIQSKDWLFQQCVIVHTFLLFLLQWFKWCLT